MSTARRWITRAVEFFDVYRAYRIGHNSRLYAARIAYGIAFRNLPF